MSTAEQPTSGPPRGSSARRFHPSAIVVLTVVWVLLWEQLSLFVVITGVLLAVLVGLVFPLPAIELHGRFRPWPALKALGRLAVDVVRASVGVVVLAFSFGTTPRSSIIRVQLWSRSDLYLTQTAELVSLVPGSIVLEARRSTSTLYLHVLDVTDDAGLAAAAQAVLDAEERVLRTFGSTAELTAFDAGRPWPQTGGA